MLRRLCCLMAIGLVGVAGQRCKDRDFTGFDLAGGPAKCEALIEHCKDETVGNEIKVLCPETCGVCVRSGKDVTADDIYIEFTKLIVANNDAIDQAAKEAKPRSKHSLKTPEYLIKQTQIDDFYAMMSSYSSWMLQACATVAKAKATKGDFKQVRIYLDAALKAYKQGKEIVYIQAGIPGPVQYSGWEDDKHVKELVKLVGAIAFQQEIEAGEYTQKKRPMAGAIEEQLRGGGTPTLGAAQPNQLAHGGYTVQPYQRELLDQIPRPLPSVGVDWVPASIGIDELREQYFEKGRPVVIGPGLLDNWPAMRRWTRSSLLRQYPGVMLNASSMPKPQYAIKPDDPSKIVDEDDVGHIWEGEPFYFSHHAHISPKVPAAGYPNATFIDLNYTLHDDGNCTVNHDDLTGLVPIAFFSDSNFNVRTLVGKVEEKGAAVLAVADFMVVPPEHRMEDNEFMAGIPILDLDRVFAKKARKLLQVDKQKSLTISVTVKRKATAQAPKSAKALEKSRYDAPAEQIPMVQYINTVMSGHKGNLTHPEGRYIFNTFAKGVQPGTDLDGPHPMWKDVVWPSLIRNASEGLFRDEPHGADTSFEFYLGPALSGAYPHVHGAAWNGCLYGRKRWIITTPEKWELIDANNANMPINVWFKEKYQALNEKHPGIFWEFVQEPGEVVFIPAGWGHGILNIEPTIGISMQMGTPYGSMPPVVQAFMEKND